MKRLLLMAPAAFGLLLASCGKQPEACFNLDQTTTEINQSVTASATCSKDVNRYSWAVEDMDGNYIMVNDEDENVVSMDGDGSASTETFTFSEPGTYIIHLCAGRGLFDETVEQTVVVTNEVPTDDNSGGSDGDPHIPTGR